MRHKALFFCAAWFIVLVPALVYSSGTRRCPRKFPVCYRDGDCVVRLCASGGCQWKKGVNYVKLRGGSCEGDHATPKEKRKNLARFADLLALFEDGTLSASQRRKKLESAESQDINAVDSSGRSLLLTMMQCLAYPEFNKCSVGITDSSDVIDAVDALLTNPAHEHINTPSSEKHGGTTPLHVACAAGKLSLIHI